MIFSGGVGFRGENTEKRMGEGEGAGVRDGEVASEGEEEREKIRRVMGRR